MACTNPLFAWVSKKMDSEGKHAVHIFNRLDYMKYNNYATAKEKLGDELMLLPCGSCPDCLEARKRDWATRCELESRYHQENVYITLTYDEHHIGNNILDRRDLQLFIKSLRLKTQKDFSYFACGEYGDKGRKHYHICLFGYWPHDARLWTVRNRLPIYKSKFLESIWQKGILEFSFFNYATAKYVAGYVDKKFGDKKGFIAMSLRPAIALNYCLENLDNLMEKGNIVLQGGVVAPIPKYFKKILRKNGIDTSLYNELLAENRHLIEQYEMNQHGFDVWEKNLFYKRDMKNKLERRRDKC